MSLVTRRIKGRVYHHLVEVEWRGGTAVTVETIHKGDRQRLAAALQQGTVTSLPQQFELQELDASLALTETARPLGVEGSSTPWLRAASGRARVIAAIHRALAPRHFKSRRQLREYREKAARSELLPLEASLLDARRVCELFASLSAKLIEAIEVGVVERMVGLEKLGLEGLAFDTTTFDRWAAAGTQSRLLQRGHDTSGRPPRALGLGSLVTEEDGLPRLTFAYPGNENGSTASRRFLRALDRRSASLKLPVQATLVGDGGNGPRQMLLRVEKTPRHYVLRLPTRHAPALVRVPRRELSPLGGSLKGKVYARKERVKSCDVGRTVVDVHSKRRHDEQLPGLCRGAKRARQLLDELQKSLQRQLDCRRRGKPLTLKAVRPKVDEALAREHRCKPFDVRVRRGDKAPVVGVTERQSAWQDLVERALGPTLLVTDRDDWTTEQVILASRRQSHDEGPSRSGRIPPASACSRCATAATRRSARMPCSSCSSFS